MNKEYIFDAAVSLFRHQGIRATRMDDVAEFLHMSKRTLYEQFPSKEEFIVACIEYEMKKEQPQNYLIVLLFLQHYPHTQFLYTLEMID